LKDIFSNNIYGFAYVNNLGNWSVFVCVVRVGKKLPSSPETHVPEVLWVE